MHNDFLAPKPVHLPEDPAAQLLAEGVDPRQIILTFPASSLAWAELAEAQLESGDDNVIAYAFARTGYHRGLDSLRGNGWKGFGSVPFDHVPNQGVIRSIAALARAARLIGEHAEYDRCRALVSDCDQDAVGKLIDPYLK